MKEAEQKLQEKYMEMKMLEEQMQQIQQQAQKVEQQLMELIATNQGLEDFKKSKEGDKILVPISSGIFIKASLKDNKQFLVNVGADTVVQKDFESTKELMERQVQEMQEFHTKIQIQMQNMNLKASKIQEELKNLAAKVE